MTTISRRQLGGLVLGAAAGSFARPALAQGAAKIVVVGGGPGGATVAVGLKRAKPSLDVVLVEPEETYTSCFFSNHYIGGFRSLASLTHSYDGVRALGVRVARDRARAIDGAKRTVTLEDGRVLPYDVLVLAPGIDFKYGAVEGLDAAANLEFPHAWRGPSQSRLLRAKLEAMEDGGLVLIAPPANPYRCPPGPYERACVIAHYLKSVKPRSKLIIVDPKMSYSKQPVFEEAFRTLYAGLVEVHLTNDIDDMALARVDRTTGVITTKSGETYKPQVANIIPTQTAGAIAVASGFAEPDWCPVDFATFQSKVAQNVYVIGDAAIAAEMPKSAFTAHNQARAVLQTILAEIDGLPRPDARYRNTCWSMIAPHNSAKIGADYVPGEQGGKRLLVPQGSFVSKPGESAALRSETYDESVAWYDTLTREMFAKG